MAHIFPEKPLTKTDGEKELINFLKDILDDSWYLFYEPLIENRQPDILLYSEMFGTVIIEVKDFRANTIKSILPNKWEIEVDNRIVSIQSPYLQAQSYCYKLIEILEKDSLFSSSLNGRIKFPVIPVCYFSNISTAELNQLDIKRFIPSENILTVEDINNDFLNKLINLFNNYFVIEEELGSLVTRGIIKKLYPEYKRNVFQKESSNKDQATIQKNNEKDFFIKEEPIIFLDLIAELLFVATQISHLIYKEKVNSRKIAIVYPFNRMYKNNSIENIISDTMNTFKIPTDINVTSVEECLDVSDLEYLFIIDCNYIRTKQIMRQYQKLFSQVQVKRIYTTANGQMWFNLL